MAKHLVVLAPFDPESPLGKWQVGQRITAEKDIQEILAIEGGAKHVAEMDVHLVVRSRFGGHEVSEIITDEEEIAAILAGEQSGHVTMIAVPAPEPPASDPPASGPPTSDPPTRGASPAAKPAAPAASPPATSQKGA